jgi:hypothetical protein
MLAAAFVAVVLPSAYFLAWFGASSARPFLVDGERESDGVVLGVAFATLTGLLIVGTGMVLLIRAGGGRYAIPGWVGQVVVVILGAFAVVLFFLSALGGLAGPPRDQSAAAQFARAMYSWFPALPILGVMAVAQCCLVWRTARLGQDAPGWRVPVVIGGFVAASVIVVVSIAALPG